MKATERTFYLGVIAVLSLLVFLQRSCNSSKGTKQPCEEKADFQPIEVTAVDTVVKVVKDSSGWHQPKPLSSSNQAQIQLISPLAVSLHTSEPKIEDKSFRDSLAVADYWNAKYYSDTNTVEGGQVIVQSTVMANRLATQRVLADIKQSTITVEKTITKTVSAKPRGQLYAGIVAQGMKTDFLTQFGASVMWKSKKDKVWTASALYGKSGQMSYQLGGSFKISFR